jgi:stearoyl-CoA desaturase (delta-9 desaturase)
VLGINRVLWGGVFLYVKESHKAETMERYGHGTPDDWVEHNVYSRFAILGLTAMGLVNVILFGLVPGFLILLTQIVWIPFWAAGVINGIGHYWGYRSFDIADASKNIVPLGILIGGEELHNNHHAYATSAKLSAKWYEFDIGWMYIRLLEALGLATVKKVLPTPRFEPAKTMCDYNTLHAVIANRYDVLARYGKALKRTWRDEVERLQHWSPRDAEVLKSLKRALVRIGYGAEADPALVTEALKPSKPGSAPPRRRSSCCASCRTGAGVPRRAGSRRWRISRGACAATPKSAPGAESKKARASGPFRWGAGIRYLSLVSL